MDSVIDLRDGHEPRAPSVAEVVTWLRQPQGSLGERLMRATAADLLEQAYAHEPLA